MKLIEVTNPNFVVNHEFDITFEDGTKITYYKDDYIDLKVSKGKLIINDKFVTDAPEKLDDYIEPVDSEQKMTESSINLESLSPVQITLSQLG